MPPSLEPVDLLIENTSEIATSRGTHAARGADLDRIDVIRNGSIAVRGDRIVAVGAQSDLHSRYHPARRLDARLGTVVPGFVDAHTHPVFAGTREDEFEMRTRGATYIEISRSGGGILSSVRGLRAASREELLTNLLLRLDRFLELGTTTIEAKSGYGLTLEDEIKSLETLAHASKQHPVEIVPTFLGAHDIPPEHKTHPAAYVTHLIEEMLPRIASANLAEYCDVFAETHTFTIEQSRSILVRAGELGMRARIHADQLTRSGGAQLAAELRAASADHLEHVDDAGIDALAAAGVIAVLCPVVPLFLRLEQEAPGRRLVDRGVGVAISTDFNPGSCYLQSLPAAMAWAALRYRMSAAEVLTAATLNAAASIGRADRIGTLEPGKQADIVCLDVPNHRHLVYEHGRNAVRWVVKKGRVAHERS
jgi:imidazolonepropionase